MGIIEKKNAHGIKGVEILLVSHCIRPTRPHSLFFYLSETMNGESGSSVGRALYSKSRGLTFETDTCHMVVWADSL